MTTYRIQKRKSSSNILEKSIETNDKIKWIPFIAPLVNKKEGDRICQELYDFYTNELKIKL